MKNSPGCRRRIYAPRGAVKTKRIPIGIDPIYLARCKAVDDAENKTDAAYVLEVYLEGQAERRKYKPAMSGLEAK
jgi:hypothetical protein